MSELSDLERARLDLRVGLGILEALPAAALTPALQELREVDLALARVMLELIARVDRQDALLEEVLRRTGGPRPESE